jgi:hypothetical protein
VAIPSAERPGRAPASAPRASSAYSSASAQATNMTYAKRCRLCRTVPPVTGRGPRYFRQPRAVGPAGSIKLKPGEERGKANDNIGAGCPQIGGSHGSTRQQPADPASTDLKS